MAREFLVVNFWLGLAFSIGDLACVKVVEMKLKVSRKSVVVDMCIGCPWVDSHFDYDIGDVAWAGGYERGIEARFEDLRRVDGDTIPDWCPLPDWDGKHGQD